MVYGYYPGCSLHSTAQLYEDTARRALALLGLEIREVPDWNCCGATPGHAWLPPVGEALARRNLKQAREAGLAEVLVPCAACYNVLARQSGPEVKIRHLLELFSEDEMLAEIEERARGRLAGRKIAPYYGCLLVRPAEIAFDDPEQPRRLDRLLTALGAEPVLWSYKTACCGGSMAVPHGQVVSELVKKIVDAARQAGAEEIATACPLCYANLAWRQGGSRKLPVRYFTELLVNALGVSR